MGHCRAHMVQAITPRMWHGVPSRKYSQLWDMLPCGTIQCKITTKYSVIPYKFLVWQPITPFDMLECWMMSPAQGTMSSLNQFYSDWRCRLSCSRKKNDVAKGKLCCLRNLYANDKKFNLCFLSPQYSCGIIWFWLTDLFIIWFVFYIALEITSLIR